MRATIATVLVGVAGAVGCGGGGGGTADPVPLEDFSARASESSCAYLFRCCADAELTSIFPTATMPPSTVGECQALAQPLLELMYGTSLRDAVDSGRAEWDAQTAGDCLAEYDSLECGGMTAGAVSAACLSAIRGTVPDGGACTSSFECASQVCSLSSHTCVPLPRIGESCTGSFTCEAGASCRSDGAGGATCMTLGAEGDPCTIGTECVSGNCSADHCAAAVPFCDGR